MKPVGVGFLAEYGDDWNVCVLIVVRGRRGSVDVCEQRRYNVSGVSEFKSKDVHGTPMYGYG